MWNYFDEFFRAQVWYTSLLLNENLDSSLPQLVVVSSRSNIALTIIFSHSRFNLYLGVGLLIHSNLDIANNTVRIFLFTISNIKCSMLSKSSKWELWSEIHYIEVRYIEVCVYFLQDNFNSLNFPLHFSLAHVCKTGILFRTLYIFKTL